MRKGRKDKTDGEVFKRQQELGRYKRCKGFGVLNLKNLSFFDCLRFFLN